MSAPNFRTITIPAATSATNPGIVRENITGRVFATVRATAAFFVRADNRGDVEQNSGRWFGNPGADEFGKLTFFNYNLSAVTVTFYAGSEAYVPDPSIGAIAEAVDVTVTNTPDVTVGNAYLYVRPAPTTISGTNVAPEDEVNFNTANRKQISVFNQDAAGGVNAVIQTTTGDTLAEVPPQTSWTMETNAPIKITTTGMAVGVWVCETIFA